ncbi:MAG: thioesterase family protein [Burkholderiaceae bacterium]|jgi:acyl-CoA thioesterase|nr:thioesterase family protein [Burkholderiaceae bacterium]
MAQHRPADGHPFDQALALTPQGAGVFGGQPHPAYANMVGPFGGITAAQMLQSVLLHPERLGEPVALTVNFAAGLRDAPFVLEARPARTNRSTQHWAMALRQKGGDGAEETMITATAVTAARRVTWSATDTPMPTAPRPAELVRQPLLVRHVRWLERYDMRFVAGHVPRAWDGAESDSATQLWMRDEPPRPLDFASLTALADVFFPRVWRRRAVMTPIGTVSMTVYFHAGASELAASGCGYLLGQARAQSFFNGFFDQSAELWNETGQLLATTHQIVYYKE